MSGFANMNNSIPSTTSALAGGVQNTIMSRIKSVGSNLSTTKIAIGVAVLIFVLLSGYYIYNTFSSIKKTYKPNSEDVMNTGSANAEAELILFYADWCPHCKTAKPVWDKIKAQYENKTVNPSENTPT